MVGVAAWGAESDQRGVLLELRRTATLPHDKTFRVYLSSDAVMQCSRTPDEYTLRDVAIYIISYYISKPATRYILRTTSREYLGLLTS
ncbi:hypothetical protein Tco_0077566 [Tanacetum coccineum]